ncbi:MAG: SMP-30/gluconolactonase/LRE family protein [Dongiaceae bacterium]
MSDVIRLHPHRAILGEGPTWRPRENALYWIDLRAPAIFRYDCASGVNRTLPVELGDRLGAMVFTESGGMVVADRTGIHQVDRANQRCLLSHPDSAQALTCFNDAKCDYRGRLWSGTADTKDTDATGSLYVFDPKGQGRRIDTGFICSNGPAFSPDGKRAYFTDSYAFEIWFYDIDPATGEIGPRQSFAKVPQADGYPDGMTVDAEGFLWNAHWAGWRITRYDPDGRIDRVLKVPVPMPTAIAFGGPDMKRLFITSASLDMTPQQLEEAPWSGCLMACDLDIAGLPDRDYALAT